jgi:hypothetical protein
MNRSLVLSWLRVSGFLYAMLAIVAISRGHSLISVGLGLVTWAEITGVGLGIGAAIGLFRAYFGAVNARARLKHLAQSDGIVSVTLMDADRDHTTYTVPGPVIAGPKRAGPVKIHFADFPLENEPWFADFTAKQPQYARAIQAVYEVMLADLKLPASTNGKHGNLSLVEHSVNVVRSMMTIASGWRYDGLRNKRGAIIRPLSNPSLPFHAFAPDDPVLPLAAFAHDIGKMECYARKRGVWEEVLPNHGERGARMLRLMPEIDALPMHDRDALLLAVEFYHHESDMPLASWVGDRAYSLCSLLYTADCDASVREGDTGEKAAVIAQYLQTKSGEAAEPKSLDPSPANATDGAPSAGRQPAQDPVGIDAEDPFDDPSQHEAAWVSDDGLSASDVLEAILATPGSINGKNTDARIGFKVGEWVYIIEPAMRSKAAAMQGDESIGRLTDTRQMHPFTCALMARLSRDGLLMDTFNGCRYSYRRALFNAAFSNGGGQRPVLVVSTKINHAMVSLPDANYAPELISPLWANPTPAGAPSVQQADAATAETSAAASDVASVTGADADEDPFSGMPPSTQPTSSDDNAEVTPAAHHDAFEFTPLDPSEVQLPVVPPKKPTVDLASLQAFAIAGETAYGMRTMMVGERRLAYFDLELLREDYSVDKDNLPAGMVIRRGNESKRLFVQVEAP